MMTSTSFLIVGNVNGHFDLLFKRLEKIRHSAAKLDFVLCTGQFFGDNNKMYNKYITSDFKIWIPIYILGPMSPQERLFYPKDLKNLSSLKENLIFLGKSGIFITAQGLKIGYLSGRPSNDSNDEISHSTNDLLLFKRKENTFNILADILVSTCCPSNISLLQPLSTSSCVTSDVAKEAVSIIKPWYHFFATDDIFYEPNPYANKDDYGNIINVTRCIGLPSIKSGNKWAYGVKFDMPRTLTNSDTQNLLQSPHTSIGGMPGYSRYAKQEKVERQPDKKFNKKECWFCMNSGTYEDHLTVYVSEFTYVALNRGGIIPDHFNIIPKNHVRSSICLKDNEYNEVRRLKVLIRKHYLTERGYEVIFFERNHKSLHALIHCIVIELNMVPKIKSLFLKKVLDLKMKIKFLENDEHFRNEVKHDQSYFYMQFGIGEICFVPIDKDFPLSFARELLCDKTVFNCPERLDWKPCILSKEKEIEIVRKLKIMFKNI